jgi:hypothetical protein
VADGPRALLLLLGLVRSGRTVVTPAAPPTARAARFELHGCLVARATWLGQPCRSAGTDGASVAGALQVPATSSCPRGSSRAPPTRRHQARSPCQPQATLAGNRPVPNHQASVRYGARGRQLPSPHAEKDRAAARCQPGIRNRHVHRTRAAPRMLIAAARNLAAATRPGDRDASRLTAEAGWRPGMCGWRRDRLGAAIARSKVR